MKLTYLARNLTLILSLAALSLFSGCIVPSMYVDPQFRSASYKDITTPASPAPVKLTVKGLTNGKENKAATDFWLKSIISVLGKSHVFAVSSANDTATLEITINNIADMGKAFKKGFATGLTLGLAGSTVTDGYIMTASYKDASGKNFSREYKHAIHSTVGAADAPIKGVKPMSMSEAPAKVAEDLVLNLLFDLQKESVLAAPK